MNASDYIDGQIGPNASDYIDQQVGPSLPSSAPTSTTVEKILSATAPLGGFFDSAADTALGASQALGSMLPAHLNVGGLDIGSDAGTQGIRELKKMKDQEIADSTPDNSVAKLGFAGGKIAGNIAQFLALAGENPGYATSTLVGGGLAASQPTAADTTNVFGTNVPSRLLNTGVGAGLAGLGKGVGDAFSTRVTDPNLAPLLKTADANDIPIYRNQTSDSRFLKALAGTLKNLPGGGGGKAAADQVGAFQDALNASVGEPPGVMNSTTLGNAVDNTGAIYNQVKQNPFISSPQFEQQLTALENSAQKNTVGDARDLFNQQLQGVRDQISSGSMTGDAAKGIISDLGAAGRGTNSSPQLRQLRTLVNNQWASTMPPEDAQSLLQADQQWRNILALEKPVGANPNGPISPTAIQGGVKNVYGNYARGGDSQLENLSRLGQLTGKNFPDSGTAVNEKILDALKHVAATTGVAGAGGLAADRGEGEGGPRLAKDAAGAAAAIMLARYGISPYVFSRMSMAPSVFGSMAPAVGGSVIPYVNSGGRQ